MAFEEWSYTTLAGAVGAVARPLRPMLPAGWRLRLEAKPPSDLVSWCWVWVHAVSVGELVLAEGLLARLREEGHRVHVTTGTPAGLELLEKRLPAWDGGAGRLSGGAFPFDDGIGLGPWLA